jgi:t-SNARE complex subunit (syntaxin)
MSASEAVRAATSRSDGDGQRKAATSTAEIQAKNFDIASLNSDISELTDSLNSLSERKVKGNLPRNYPFGW